MSCAIAWCSRSSRPTRRSVRAASAPAGPDATMPSDGSDPLPRLPVSVVDDDGRPVRAPALAAWLARVAPARARGAVTIALVSDRRVRTLNRQYRGIDRATDVLSFPARDVIGVEPGRRFRRRTRDSVDAGNVE